MPALFPKMADQWHPTKNGDLTPEGIVAGSANKIWWKCDQGPDHEWSVSVISRTHFNSGCPYCAKQRVSVTNSLANIRPDIAKEWHPTQNGDLGPNQLVDTSNKRVWWKCDQGPDHEWQATVDSRTRSGAGCPYCNGRKVSITNSLSILHPDIAKEWHPTKNGDLTPSGVTAGTTRKVWWKCDQGPDHEWDSQIVQRTFSSQKRNKTGCPFCAGKKASITNNLLALYPEISKLWHPSKNGDLKPNLIVSGSNKKYWWKCPEGMDHEWQTSPSILIGNHRKHGGNGCPCCSGKKVSVTNSLASCFPEVAQQWHPEKNGEITPKDIVAGTHKKYWWKCEKGPDHEWQASGDTRIGGHGCPYCSGRKASITKSLSSLRPDLCQEWHPTRNLPLKPSQVTVGSSKQIWWKCKDNPDHEWQDKVHARTTGRGCHICKEVTLRVFASLKAAKPEIAKEWHPTKNGDLTPEEVSAHSGRKVWWKCEKGPDHEWQAQISNRTKDNPTGCPCCIGRKLSVTNSLVSLYPKIAGEWFYQKNGNLKPDCFTAGSYQRVWWKCDQGPDHEWESTIYNRTSGKGCPFCVSHQLSVTNILSINFPEIAAQWHPTKNGALSPEQVTFGSSKKYWWKCDKGPDHEWVTTVAARTSGKSGCPFCSGHKLSSTNRLMVLYPEVASQWHPTKNGDLTAADVTYGHATGS